VEGKGEEEERSKIRGRRRERKMRVLIILFRAKLLTLTDITTLKFITGIFFLSLAHKKKENLVFSEFFGIFGGFRIIFFVGVIESISTDALNKLAFYSTGGMGRRAIMKDEGRIGREDEEGRWDKEREDGGEIG
jgi:hypothetical protein